MSLLDNADRALETAWDRIAQPDVPQVVKDDVTGPLTEVRENLRRTQMLLAEMADYVSEADPNLDVAKAANRPDAYILAFTEAIARVRQHLADYESGE